MLSIWLEKPFPLAFALKHSLLLSLWYSLSTQVIGKSVCFRLERLSEDVGLYCVRGVWVWVCADGRVWVCADGCVCRRACVSVWVCADVRVCRMREKGHLRGEEMETTKLGDRFSLPSNPPFRPLLSHSLSLSLSLSLHNVCAHPSTRTHTHLPTFTIPSIGSES